MNGAEAVFVGCAGWSLPRSFAARFPGDGSHLERYSGRFSAVEINSSFYRPHLPKTYSRWAASVPAGFRFAVKMPREITHKRRLVRVEQEVRAFVAQVSALGEKLGPMLIQLPPRLPFAGQAAHAFFDMFRVHYAGKAVCEPRHVSWFTPEADELLATFQTARAAADPALAAEASRPGGWRGMVYYRLHGSPRMYYSSYDAASLSRVAGELQGHAVKVETWCIFDNTAENAAQENALELLRLLKDG